MRLNNIGMVAADTSRSKAYLQALIKNNLFPNYVLLLESTSQSLLPGQSIETQEVLITGDCADSDGCWSEARFDLTVSLKSCLDNNKIAYDLVTNTDINDPVISEILCKRLETTFIYSGFGGVLLRKEILALDKKFLHVHGGYLSKYKGSTTNYYSLLMEGSLGASAIFLTEEIDSGPVLHRRQFPLPRNLTHIDHVYDSAARAKVLIETLQSYLEFGEWKFELPNNAGGETYYIIHPVLKHIAMLGKGERN